MSINKIYQDDVEHFLSFIEFIRSRRKRNNHHISNLLVLLDSNKELECNVFRRIEESPKINIYDIGALRIQYIDDTSINVRIRQNDIGDTHIFNYSGGDRFSHKDKRLNVVEAYYLIRDLFCIYRYHQDDTFDMFISNWMIETI